MLALSSRAASGAASCGCGIVGRCFRAARAESCGARLSSAQCDGDFQLVSLHLRTRDSSAVRGRAIARSAARSHRRSERPRVTQHPRRHPRLPFDELGNRLAHIQDLNIHKTIGTKDRNGEETYPYKYIGFSENAHIEVTVLDLNRIKIYVAAENPDIVEKIATNVIQVFG